MKKINKSLGQKKRKAKNDMAEGCLTLIWNILKYTIFLPFTILYLIIKRMIK